MEIDREKEELAAELKGSLQKFIKYFIKHITRRSYAHTFPKGRESHQITICRELTKLLHLENDEENLLINVHPGSGKTLHVCMWIAWCFAHYPDSHFIYISYSFSLSAKHTALIKDIMSSRQYAYLFDVHIARETRAKHDFATTAGGRVAAFGSGGAVTGRDAGLPSLDRFSGAVVIDDAQKPSEVHSDSLRETVIRNYKETICQRPRGKNVPIVYIGQRLHEDDICNFFISGQDIKRWKKVILKSLDEAENALHPELHTKEYLQGLRKKSEYVFASQFQQDPLPSGGSLLKPEYIVQLREYPEIFMTFITADTAETSKNYNDATVFSFWGLYEIESFERKTGIYGLHWIDCVEIRVEPKDLQGEFLDFWQNCCRFKVPPLMAAIEKKSTGVTLLSILKDIRGISIRNIERTRQSGSKADRFISIQWYVGNKQVSINEDAKHKQMCLDHISKITANDTHRFDDIADTLADAVDIALIQKAFNSHASIQSEKDDKMDPLKESISRRINAGKQWNYYG